MIGNKIKQIRQNSSLSQHEFAGMFGINRATLSNYEADKRKVPASLVAKIIRQFEINPEWLLNDCGSMYGDASVDAESSDSIHEVVEINVINTDQAAIVHCDDDEDQSITQCDDHILLSQKLLDGYPGDKVGIVLMIGDAMEPTLKQGDFILFVYEEMVDSGIYVISQKGKIIIRRVQNFIMDKVHILCDNPKYQDELYFLEHMKEKDIHILGRVIKRIGIL